jgi:co-chaperonin GroES (HSP10)
VTRASDLFHGVPPMLASERSGKITATTPREMITHMRERPAMPPVPDKIRVLGDRVLVHEITFERLHSFSGGSLVIPATAKEKYTLFGYVMCLGDLLNSDNKRPAAPVKVGDVVEFSRFTETTHVGGQQYRYVPTHELYARYESIEDV